MFQHGFEDFDGPGSDEGDVGSCGKDFDGEGDVVAAFGDLGPDPWVVQGAGDVEERDDGDYAAREEVLQYDPPCAIDQASALEKIERETRGRDGHLRPGKPVACPCLARFKQALEAVTAASVENLYLGSLNPLAI